MTLSSAASFLLFLLVDGAKASGLRQRQHRSAVVVADFTIDLRHSRCPGLVAQPAITDEALCASACEADPDCEVWQFCPAGKSCEKHDETFTGTGSTTRCWMSAAGTSRGMCLPEQGRKWLGAAREGSGRVPFRTSPVTTKRGFSGYLKQTLDDGTSIPPICSDAEALNRYVHKTAPPMQEESCCCCRTKTSHSLQTFHFDPI